jgi:hypothetical protein
MLTRDRTDHDEARVKIERRDSHHELEHRPRHLPPYPTISDFAIHEDPDSNDELPSLCDENIRRFFASDGTFLQDVNNTWGDGET